MRGPGRRWGIVALAALAVCTSVVAVLASPGSAQEAPPPAATTSETFQVGPLALAPHGQPGDQVNRLGDPVPRPAGDVAVRGITWRFVDENGNDVSSHMAHLHHMVLLDTGRRDQLCSYPPASRFAATGKELSPLTLPEGYAYHSPADAPWLGVYHVMNMSDQPMTVAIEYTVEYAPAGDLLDVEPYFLDVDGCWGDSAYPVPGDGGPGSVHEQSRTYTMTREGSILVGGGHLHDGGIDITLDGLDGEVCRSTAVYDPHDAGHLVGMTPCAMGEEFSVGDQYTLTARYENDEPIPGAMGIMLSYVHHTDPPPPEPEVDVELGALGPDGLTVELSCANATEVYVDGYVSQQKGGGPAVTGWGTALVPCADGTVTVPLGGDGMLTGGDVMADVYAWVEEGPNYAADAAWGTVQMTGRLDLLTVPGPSGDRTVTVDQRAVATAEGQAVTGTVGCDEARESWMLVLVRGRQRVGTHAVAFEGSQFLRCTGTTAYSVPVRSWDGRLAAGPAVVTVEAYSMLDGGTSTAPATVKMRAEQPGSTELPAPPPSPLTLTGAQRTGDGVAVTVSFADCPAGGLLWVGGSVEAVQGRGRRVPPPSAGTGAQVLCDGSDVSLTLPAVDVSGNRVFVQAYASVEIGGDWIDASTWGELDVSG